MFARRREVARARGRADRRARRPGRPHDPARTSSGSSQATVEAFGGIDVLVLNGGGPPAGTALDVDRRGGRGGRRAPPRRRTSRSSRAASPTSGRAAAAASSRSSRLSVKEPIANLALSNAVRPGVVGWLKTLARELGPDGITVNTIAPGRIDTERLRVALRRGRPSAGGPRADPRRAGSARRPRSPRSPASSPPSGPRTSPAPSSRSTAGSPAACCESVDASRWHRRSSGRGAPGGRRSSLAGDASRRRLPLRPERAQPVADKVTVAGREDDRDGAGRHLLRRRHGAPGALGRAAAAVPAAGRRVARAAAGGRPRRARPSTSGGAKARARWRAPSRSPPPSRSRRRASTSRRRPRGALVEAVAADVPRRRRARGRRRDRRGATAAR